MQIENKRINSFVLVLIITTIALISVVLLFLSATSNSMMFQANNTYLQACERNLISSGLNWAKLNLQKNNSQNFNNMVELDIAELDILNSSLKVKINSSEEQQHQVQVTTSCGRERLNLTSEESYTIEK